MNSGIPGEKKCEVCECMFVNKDNLDAKRCKVCDGLGPEAAGANEKFIYQDVKRSDIESKLNTILSKQDLILKLLRGDKPGQEYSKKCETCNSVFVSSAPASRYCDDCKETAKK